MRFIQSLFIILFVSTFTSCSVLWEYRETHDIEDYSWSKSKVQNFEATLENDGIYSLKIIGQHLSGFPYQNLDLLIQIDSDNTSESRSISIPIKDSNGNYTGEGSMDYWDFEQTAFSEIKLLKGTYKISITSEMSEDPIKLLTSLGVMIE